MPFFVCFCFFHFYFSHLHHHVLHHPHLHHNVLYIFSFIIKFPSKIETSYEYSFTENTHHPTSARNANKSSKCGSNIFFGALSQGNSGLDHTPHKMLKEFSLTKHKPNIFHITHQYVHHNVLNLPFWTFNYGWSTYTPLTYPPKALLRVY